MTNILKTLTLGALLGTSSAFAVSFQLGNIADPSGNSQNVVFNGAGTDTGPANPVTGRLNTTSALVDFFSPGMLQAEAHGQADITGTGSPSIIPAGTSVTVQMNTALDGFTYIQLNPIVDNPPGGGPPPSGTATYVANLVGGGSEQGVLALGNGENRTTIIAGPGQTILSLQITADIDLNDIRQFRITSGTANVPDGGASVLLLGFGLLGLAGFRSYRQ